MRVLRSLAIALGLAVAVSGCSERRGGGPSSPRPPDASGAGRVTILEGRSGDVVVWATPLGLGEAPTEWYRERLTALDPVSAGRSFVLLFVFHVGKEGAPPLRLDDLTVDVETADDLFAHVPVLAGDASPAVRASVLVSKALTTFEGARLPPGQMLEALVGFEGRFVVEDLVAGRFTGGGVAVRLAAERLPWTELQRLLESPGREALFARVMDDGTGSAPEGR